MSNVGLIFLSNKGYISRERTLCEKYRVRRLNEISTATVYFYDTGKCQESVFTITVVVSSRLKLAILMVDTGCMWPTFDILLVASSGSSTLNCFPAWRQTLLSCSADTTLSTRQVHTKVTYLIYEMLHRGVIQKNRVNLGFCPKKTGLLLNPDLFWTTF